MVSNLLKTKLFMRGSILAAALVALAACDEDGNFNLSNSDADATAPAPIASGASVPLVERDVEAPEVFQVNEAGLWDGRPSLGGVWVAHPDVTDPERVIIRNTTNDKFVIGALFRRERDNPGPALQVSSDAAVELGLLAGAPTTLNVTALRREETPEIAPEAVATTDFDTPAQIAATPLDPIAGAAAAIDAAQEAGQDPTEAPIVAAAITPEPAAAPRPAASSLDKPFVQIGIFSVEANATGTAERLRGDGLSTRVLAQESQGRPFWRVIVGPAPTAEDRAAILEKVKALGFADAYFVTN